MSKGWEHKVVVAQGSAVDFSVLAANLDKIAVDGWELAAVQPIAGGTAFYFKRPKQAIIPATTIAAGLA